MAERTKTEIALKNCRMLAAREIRRHDIGKASSAVTYAAWKHILRFCETAGVTGSILREAARDMKADMYGENGNGRENR